MFLCLFAAYPCVTSLRFSYASLCYSITFPFFAFALSGSSIQGRTPLRFATSIHISSLPIHISAILCSSYLSHSFSGHCPAALRRSYASPRHASPFHCFADPFYTSLRYSVALLFPAAPFHIIAQPFNAAALLFFTIPSLNSSLLFRLDAIQSLSFAFRSNSCLFIAFACHFFAHRIAAYPLPNLAMPFHYLSLLCLF
jgi:hypothetical protein